MKNPFRRLDEIERDLGDVAIQITRAHFCQFTTMSGWEPAINAFRCGDQIVVCVELAGVERSAIQVRAEPRRLTLRGSRPIAEPACEEAPALQVLALEIDHGVFERQLDLPVDVDPDRVTAEHRNGLLWIKMPFRAHA
jgi:HSP20 family protein